jgi:hypothetical protein
MDWFKVIVLLVLGYLLYREFTRKKYIKLEHLGNTGPSGIGITEYSDKLVITKPIVFQNDVTCMNAKMENLTVTGINATGIKTNDIKTSTFGADKITTSTMRADDISTGTISTDTISTRTMNSNIVNAENVAIGNELFVGRGLNKWHMRDTRLGITGKFDLVPGFTTGSVDGASKPLNDNWLRLLNYNSLNTGSYFKEGGLAAERSFIGVESWNNKLNANSVNIKDYTLQQGGNPNMPTDNSSLYISQGKNVIGRFSNAGDRLLIFRNMDGKRPYFYVNDKGSNGWY